METAIVPTDCQYTKKRCVHKQHLQMQKAQTFQTKSNSAFISEGGNRPAAVFSET